MALSSWLTKYNNQFLHEETWLEETDVKNIDTREWWERLRWSFLDHDAINIYASTVARSISPHFPSDIRQPESCPIKKENRRIPTHIISPADRIIFVTIHLSDTEYRGLFKGISVSGSLFDLRPSQSLSKWSLDLFSGTLLIVKRHNIGYWVSYLMHSFARHAHHAHEKKPPRNSTA